MLRAGADWCAPCKQMERTTWRDERVLAFIERHVKVVEFDIDTDPDFARDQRIDALPTVIAFRDGREVGRFVGVRDAQWVLDWLAGIHNGQTDTQILADRVQTAATPEASWIARLELAHELLTEGQNQDHTAELAEALWRDLAAIERHESIAEAAGALDALLAQLAQDPAIAERLALLLPDSIGEHDGEPTPIRQIALAHATGRHGLVAAWYRDADQDDRSAVLAARRPIIVRSLAAAERWSDVLEITERVVPVTRFVANRTERDGMYWKLEERSRRAFDDEAFEECLLLYRACLATGRSADAQRIHELIRKRWPTASVLKQLNAAMQDHATRTGS